MKNIKKLITFIPDSDVARQIEFLKSCDVVISRVINKALRHYFATLIKDNEFIQDNKPDNNTVKK